MRHAEALDQIFRRCRCHEGLLKRVILLVRRKVVVQLGVEPDAGVWPIKPHAFRLAPRHLRFLATRRDPSQTNPGRAPARWSAIRTWHAFVEPRFAVKRHWPAYCPVVPAPAHAWGNTLYAEPISKPRQRNLWALRPPNRRGKYARAVWWTNVLSRAQ